MKTEADTAFENRVEALLESRHVTKRVEWLYNHGFIRMNNHSYRTDYDIRSWVKLGRWQDCPVKVDKIVVVVYTHLRTHCITRIESKGLLQERELLKSYDGEVSSSEYYCDFKTSKPEQGVMNALGFLYDVIEKYNKEDHVGSSDDVCRQVALDDVITKCSSRICWARQWLYKHGFNYVHVFSFIGYKVWLSYKGRGAEVRCSLCKEDRESTREGIQNIGIPLDHLWPLVPDQRKLDRLIRGMSDGVKMRRDRKTVDFNLDNGEVPAVQRAAKFLMACIDESFIERPVRSRRP